MKRISENRVSGAPPKADLEETGHVWSICDSIIRAYGLKNMQAEEWNVLPDWRVCIKTDLAIDITIINQMRFNDATDVKKLYCIYIAMGQNR